MFALAQLRIGPRLALCFGLVICLFIAMAFIAIGQIRSLTDINSNVINNEVEKLLETTQVNHAAQAGALTLLQILLTQDRDQRVPLYAKLDADNKKIDTYLTNLKPYIQQDKFTSLHTLHEQYKSAFIETVELLELDSETAFEHFHSDTKAILEQLNAGIEALVQSKTNELQTHVQSTQTASRDAEQIVTGLGLAVVFVCVLSAILVSRSIVRPLHTSVKTANELAEGNIPALASSPYKDEVAELTNAFVTMCDNLHTLVSAIRESSDQLTQSAGELNTPVSSVKSGSDQQNIAVANILQRVETFNEGIGQVRTTAEHAKEQSDFARQLAQEGAGLIQQATQEFKQISNTITNSADTVESLSEQASSIRHMITTVREIAEQTNLLALNAAIEAARAGESGRGFSVVADEVRSLANRTEDATCEINDVIDAIDKETQAAVIQIGTGRKELEKGVAIIQQMVSPLQELSQGAQSSFENLSDLESAVRQQASDSNDIRIHLDQIGAMAADSQVAASTVNETTQELLNVASQLSQQINRFNLR